MSMDAYFFHGISLRQVAFKYTGAMNKRSATRLPIDESERWPVYDDEPYRTLLQHSTAASPSRSHQSRTQQIEIRKKQSQLLKVLE